MARFVPPPPLRFGYRSRWITICTIGGRSCLEFSTSNGIGFEKGSRQSSLSRFDATRTPRRRCYLPVLLPWIVDVLRSAVKRAINLAKAATGYGWAQSKMEVKQAVEGHFTGTEGVLETRRDDVSRLTVMLLSPYARVSMPAPFVYPSLTFVHARCAPCSISGVSVEIRAPTHRSLVPPCFSPRARARAQLYDPRRRSSSRWLPRTRKRVQGCPRMDSSRGGGESYVYVFPRFFPVSPRSYRSRLDCVSTVMIGPLLRARSTMARVMGMENTRFIGEQ